MAFQKVMISGIHTSELTVLKEEEKMAHQDIVFNIQHLATLIRLV